MKDELGGNIMTYLSALGSNMYSYLTDDSDKNIKTKDNKKCVIK